MFGQVSSGAILGIDGYLVQVEADVCNGLPSFDMVGFLGSEVREARERVRTALRNSGYEMPPARTTINLSPADLRKEGNYFDLPIAVAVLIAIGILPQKAAEGVFFVGELSLDGSLRPVNGMISLISTARQGGMHVCIVPAANGKEGAVIEGVQVYGMKNLSDVTAFLLGEAEYEPEKNLDTFCQVSYEGGLDFSDINGQESVKRATIVAAAGMHNILYVGPPGSGKTMIARRLPTILPPLTKEESIEISKVYSICGLLPSEQGLIWKRPFRSPHHTISPTALTGGGQIPRPGEITLANRGVLFLDELPEFQKSTLEILRQPLEDKQVIISRVNGTYTYPTNFLLAAAMNPCKCGFYPDRRLCHCSEAQVHQYLNHISQPLLDRIDICVEVPKLLYQEFTAHKQGLTSAQLREKIGQAIAIQKERYKGESVLFNSQLSPMQVKRYCGISGEEEAFLKDVFETMELSARAYHKILKVARTIADLEGAEKIGCSHLAEAIGYRSLDKKYWGR